MGAVNAEVCVLIFHHVFYRSFLTAPKKREEYFWAYLEFTFHQTLVGLYLRVSNDRIVLIRVLRFAFHKPGWH